MCDYYRRRNCVLEIDHNRTSHAFPWREKFATSSVYLRLSQSFSVTLSSLMWERSHRSSSFFPAVHSLVWLLGRLFTQRFRAVLRLRRLVAGLSPRRSGFAPESVYVGQNGTGTRFLRVFRFHPVNIIPRSYPYS
jgi:hypothetical protein